MQVTRIMRTFIIYIYLLFARPGHFWTFGKQIAITVLIELQTNVKFNTLLVVKHLTKQKVMNYSRDK